VGQSGPTGAAGSGLQVYDGTGALVGPLAGIQGFETINQEYLVLKDGFVWALRPKTGLFVFYAETFYFDNSACTGVGRTYSTHYTSQMLFANQTDPGAYPLYRIAGPAAAFAATHKLDPLASCAPLVGTILADMAPVEQVGVAPMPVPAPLTIR
jgi:hypothetical protein